MSDDIDLAVNIADEARIINQLIAIPVKELPRVLLKMTEVRKAVQRLEGVAEARLKAEWSTVIDEGAWRHPETNVAYTFDGTATWKVENVDAFKKALIAAWSGIRLTDADATEAIRDAYPPLAEGECRLSMVEKTALFSKIDKAFKSKLEPVHAALNTLITEHPALASVIWTHRTRAYGPSHLIEMEKKA